MQWFCRSRYDPDRARRAPGVCREVCRVEWGTVCSCRSSRVHGTTLPARRVRQMTATHLTRELRVRPMWRQVRVGWVGESQCVSSSFRVVRWRQPCDAPVSDGSHICPQAECTAQMIGASLRVRRVRGIAHPFAAESLGALGRRQGSVYSSPCARGSATAATKYGPVILSLVGAPVNVGACR